MVENKKTKRQRDIKAKLMAAIAMLLVSSIMMVSTTYAWFTLSTAPEVTGITTSIAANGNLEIALSPRSGIGTDVVDATTATATQGWLIKNRTWGNLVDMSDPEYGLAALTLAPAQLALTGTEGAYTLGDNVLATPSYGSDGRISALTVNAYIAGKAEGATGYNTDTDYGVRAVGRASGMSAQESKFKTSVGAIGTYASNAVGAAANSLAENGDALAGMLVTHAAVQSGEDTNDYRTHIDALVALTTDLNAAITNIDEALRAALAAAASHIEDEKTFEAAIVLIEGKSGGEYANSIDKLLEMVGDDKQLPITIPDQFNNIIAKRNAVATKIATAVTAAGNLKTYADANPDAKIPWTGTDDVPGVSSVLGDLMNINGDIKVSGQSIAAIKQAVADKNMNYLMGLVNDCSIELGAGSGVYYDLAEITGNITARVPEVPISITYGGLNFEDMTLKNVIIKTTVPANTSMLPLMRTAMAAKPPEIEGGDAVMDSFFGYVIDLMVRTNAADSSLKLQSDPAQRVYNDSTSEATQGQGSTISFKTTKLNNVATLNNLLNSINVVFFDPSRNNKVLGMAKVSGIMTTENKIGTEEVTVAGQTQTVDVIEYTVTGTLELCEIKAATNVGGSPNGLYVAGEKLESQVLCELTQNVPQAISAMVYLDGEDVTSADVLADKAITGALNLQFASTATLVPMENSDLRNMTVPTESESQNP